MLKPNGPTSAPALDETGDYQEMPLPRDMFGDDSLFSRAILDGLLNDNSDNKIWFFPNHPQDTSLDSPYQEQATPIVSNPSTSENNESENDPNAIPGQRATVATPSEQKDNTPAGTLNFTPTSNNSPTPKQEIQSMKPSVPTSSSENSQDPSNNNLAGSCEPPFKQPGTPTIDNPTPSMNLTPASNQTENVLPQGGTRSDSNPNPNLNTEDDTSPSPPNQVNNIVGVGGVINNIVNDIINITNITTNVVNTNYYGNDYETPSDSDLAQLEGNYGLGLK